MKRLFYTPLFIVLTMSVFISCSPDDDGSSSTGIGKDSDKEITFINYTPTEGTGGTEIAISGKNFGEDANIVTVWVNDIKAELLSVAPTRINFRVAENSGTGPVKVKVGEVEHTFTQLFTYIEDVNPTLYVSTLA